LQAYSFLKKKGGKGEKGTSPSLVPPVIPVGLRRRRDQSGKRGKEGGKRRRCYPFHFPTLQKGERKKEEKGIGQVTPRLFSGRSVHTSTHRIQRKRKRQKKNTERRKRE